MFRCFPHVVNIAVKAGLKVLSITLPSLPSKSRKTSTTASGGSTSTFPSPPSSAPTSFSNLIAIRASGLRREDFETLIREGNTNKEWLGNDGKFLELPVLALLRDVDTRWSSTFLMINRLLVLYNAVAKLLASEKYRATLGPLALSSKQLEALDDVRKFLGALHAAQQLLSSQRTPTLCHVLPVYGKLIKTLTEVKDICPKISHGIEKSIAKLKEYMSKAQDNRTYALAMSMSTSLIVLAISDVLTDLQLLQSSTHSSSFRGSKKTRHMRSRIIARPSKKP
ncbi:hypothetical protein EV714DRAFT_207673 [Schizophyllum commune]